MAGAGALCYRGGSEGGRAGSDDRSLPTPLDPDPESRPVIRRILIGCTILGLLAAPRGALADTDALLKEASNYYEQLEYMKALKVLVQIQSDKGANPLQKATAFLYMGVCFTALGNAENAVQSFMMVLKLRPQFRMPPGVSPSIRAMFAEALRRLKMPETPPPQGQGQGQGQEQGPAKGQADEQTVDVRAEAPKSLTVGRPIEVKIQVDDPDKKVKAFVIHWRRHASPSFSKIRLPRDAKKAELVAVIPGATVGAQSGRLLYYVVAEGNEGAVVGAAGNDEEPKEVELLSPPRRRSRWGWYVLGIGGSLAIAGGIVAAVLATRGSGNGTLPPGSANLSVTIK